MKKVLLALMVVGTMFLVGCGIDGTYAGKYAGENISIELKDGKYTGKVAGEAISGSYSKVKKVITFLGDLNATGEIKGKKLTLTAVGPNGMETLVLTKK